MATGAPPHSDLHPMRVCAPPPPPPHPIQMATGAPPHSDLHPMRVLFLIPKNEPPRLEGDKYSAACRDFVATCLQRDPGARPAASALLSHPFVAAASPPADFADMIQVTALRAHQGRAGQGGGRAAGQGTAGQGRAGGALAS